MKHLTPVLRIRPTWQREHLESDVEPHQPNIRRGPPRPSKQRAISGRPAVVPIGASCGAEEVAIADTICPQSRVRCAHGYRTLSLVRPRLRQPRPPRRVLRHLARLEVELGRRLG